MFELKDLDSIQIGLASPDKIREWSYGEVEKAETINYRTLKPERDGLFCEKIFGPTKDWECACGKYKRTRNKGVKCDKCGVEVTRAKVRRERMGHIELAAPVSHIWYFKGIPSRMGTLLNISPRALEQVLYFASYIVLDKGNTTLTELQLLSENEYQQLQSDAAEKGYTFRVGIGAEAIKELLQKVDLDELNDELRKELADMASKPNNRDSESQKRQRIVKRLEVVEAFRKSGNKPEWMVLDVVPVIPPELRPMVQLDGGRFATADLNDLYRRVINRNNRLKRMLEMGAPDIIVRNEKRMLQEAVDALIDNGRRGRPVTGAGGRQLKSLSDLLRGKQGRFRQNLLGKRVDYSGRSVIVVGPTLKMYQCGLPKEMALELFKPFVIERLVRLGLAQNVKTAKRAVERLRPEVWDVLETVIKDHPVMLNRAPTLHRLGIQAFEPVLVEGKALKLHPLCCSAFNADFDGDQMAVHVPLSMEAQAEARFLMLSANNILKPADGKPVVTPSQDMVLGCYYLTIQRTGLDTIGIKNIAGALPSYPEDLEEALKTYAEDIPEELQAEAAAISELEGEEKTAKVKDIFAKMVDNRLEKYMSIYTDIDEAMMAYATGDLHLQAVCKIRMKKTINGVERTHMVKTSIGRIILNSMLPQDMGMTKRDASDIDSMFKLEVDEVVGKKQLGKIIDACYRTHGVTTTVTMLDNVKSLGYRFSTVGSLTVSFSDIIVPEQKKPILDEAQTQIKRIEREFKRGRMSEDERYKAVIRTWEDATNRVTKEVLACLTKFNPINMMATSGARGSTSQIRQLSGMRGLMASTSGKTIELPIRSNFREGLTVLEFFLSSHGSRKALSDTALRTADSGYMTRRLVDVSQEIIVREIDCFANRGMTVTGQVVRAIEKQVVDNNEKAEMIESLKDRIMGRVAASDIINPLTGEVMVRQNELITFEMAEKITDLKKEVIGADGEVKKEPAITEVNIRTVLTCQCEQGVCAHCYGADMAHGGLVNVGEAVGIISAQAIGEPGTQLTMRNFHTGGVAGASDITQGLPRVEELFEARKPKHEATLTEISGVVHMETDNKKKHEIVVTSQDTENGEAEVKRYPLNYGSKAKVKEGSVVKAGDELIEGSINPHDLLRILGANAVQDYLVREVQSVYRGQGVDIADKHIETIVRQMLRKVRIEDAHGTDLLPGSLVDQFTFRQANMKAMSEGNAPATAKRVLLGITKASLATDSFMSAASFQETTRVLTEAAINGKVDPLRGIKENVIIGKLIPAGTGMKRYNDIQIHENF